MFIIDFDKKDLGNEPCIVCGKPSQRVMAHSHTAETSMHTPESKVRFLFYGLCGKCFERKGEFTTEELRTIAVKALRMEAQEMHRLQEVQLRGRLQ